MSAKRFTDEQLAALRAMPLERVFEKLELYYTKDPDYKPRKDLSGVRYNVSVEQQVFEILVTGVRWYDTWEKKGGGGAIDLTMHLLALDFRAAVKRLLQP